MGTRPSVKPQNPNFSAGPCSKRPGYSVANLDLSVLGRSHRSEKGKATLKKAVDLTHEILNLPAGYRVGIVPASDTGAVEMALWNMLGERPVDVCSWESFGAEWYIDIATQLNIEYTHFTADYGQLPALEKTNPAHDIVFTWNGTTSGIKVPNADWIADDREGLTICDATSAVFAMDMPWEKLDVVTYSWQKVLGGEGAHGILILSPKAVERLESYTPAWPIPKIFRLTQGGKLIDSIFEGVTINTPSMLCVVDYIDTLNWVKSIGGVAKAIDISETSLSIIEEFVDNRDWIHFLAKDKHLRSSTSVCLTLDLEESQVKQLIDMIEEAGAGYDFNSYRDAPTGLRLWCGVTVQPADIQALLPWIEWAYQELKNTP